MMDTFEKMMDQLDAYGVRTELNSFDSFVDYAESSSDNVQFAGCEEKIPGRINAILTPYKFLDSITGDIRLGFSINEGKIKVRLTAPRLEASLEALIGELSERLESKTGIKPLI